MREAGIVATVDAPEDEHEPNSCERLFAYDAEEEPPRPTLVEGDLVDRYRVGRLIGEGGHGLVYEAEHVQLGYPVALKVMDRYAGLDPRRRARFRREALLGARLRHRNVVSIFEAGELRDGSPYLVMEHVDGVELAQIVEKAPLDAAATVDLGVQLLAAVAALAEQGILHRDIKPHNLMLHRSVDGAVELKLLDFGISKALRTEEVGRTLTQEGFVLGTPQYMSPEQVRGTTLDVRSDLYAVAAVLYEALTTRPPLDAETTEGVLTRILLDDPTPLREAAPSCPLELAEVIERGLHKDRERRYESPRSMAEALRHVAQRLGLPRGADAWGELDTLVVRAPRPPIAGWVPAPTPRRVTATDHAVPAAVPTENLESAPRVTGPARSVAAMPSEDGGSTRGRWLTVAGVILALGGGWAWTEVSADRPVVAQPLEPAFVEPLPSMDDAASGTQAVAIVTRPEERVTSLAPQSVTVQPVGRPSRPPVDASELERRALAAIVRGDARRAMGFYRQAVRAEPNRPSAWRGLGLAAATAGDRIAAERAFQRYLSLAPAAPDRTAIERRRRDLGAGR